MTQIFRILYTTLVHNQKIINTFKHFYYWNNNYNVFSVCHISKQGAEFEIQFCINKTFLSLIPVSSTVWISENMFPVIIFKRSIFFQKMLSTIFVIVIVMFSCMFIIYQCPSVLFILYSITVSELTTASLYSTNLILVNEILSSCTT